jgi:hypothetical protein
MDLIYAKNQRAFAKKVQ